MIRNFFRLGCALATHTGHRQFRRRRPVRGVLLALGLAATLAGVMALLPPMVSAQFGEGDSIFRRFDSGRTQAATWQAMVEVPVAVRPSTMPDAEIVANTGLNYTLALRPENRLFISRSYQFGRMEWKPVEPDLRTVRVIEFGVSEMLNFRLGNAMFMGLGLGIGVMDGTIVYNDERNFDTRLEPFIPVHFVLGTNLGSSFVASVKVSQSSYFGPGPVLSVLRTLVGVGWKY